MQSDGAKSSVNAVWQTVTNPDSRKKGSNEMAKYESIIKVIARMMVERRYESARHHIKRLMKHYDDMTDVEIEVVEELRVVAFNK